MNLSVIVKNKIATLATPEIIVCGNSDYTITFTFDDEWSEEAIKTARFAYRRGGENRFEDVVFTGNTVEVPVLSNITAVLVGVYAGELRTTTPAVISCEKSILCGGGTHDAPPDNVYNQILNEINELIGLTGSHPVRTDNPHGVTIAQIGAQAKHKPKKCNLTVAGWSSLKQTVSVSGVTADNTLLVTPAPASQDVYCEAGVKCSAQAAGSLTFECTDVPAEELKVNVVILD